MRLGLGFGFEKSVVNAEATVVERTEPWECVLGICMGIKGVGLTWNFSPFGKLNISSYRWGWKLRNSRSLKMSPYLHTASKVFLTSRRLRLELSSGYQEECPF